MASLLLSFFFFFSSALWQLGGGGGSNNNNSSWTGEDRLCHTPLASSERENAREMTALLSSLASLHFQD